MTASATTRLLDLDREHLDLRLATGAIVAILIAAALETLIGQGALQAAVAAFLVSQVGGRGTVGTRVGRMAAVTIVGGAIGFLAYVSAESVGLAALVLAVVSYVTGLAYAYGASIGRVGYLLLLWAMAILIGQAHGDDPPATAVAVFVGGAVAIVVAVIRARVEGDRPPAQDAIADQSEVRPASIVEVIKSDLGLWSLIRAGLTVVAVIVGFQLTANLDPFWVAIALLIVFVPDRDQATFKAMQRGLGTFVGALTTLVILSTTDSAPAIAGLAFVATFGAVACYRANYMIYAFFLTNAVLMYYWLATAHEVGVPGQRLIATVIGIALALAGVAVMGLVRRTRGQPQDELDLG
jgi:uncharacterized membrane protein YccC